MKALRKQRNWTQEDLRKKLGWTQPDVSRAERGVTSLSETKIRQLAEVFEVSTAVILGEKDEPHQPTKYSEVITKLIMEARLKGQSPTRVAEEEMKKLLNILVTDDMRRGAELDLERYQRYLSALNKKTKEK